MKFKTPLPLEAIAGKYHCEVIGDATLIATGINEIHKVEAGDITFVDVEKYFQKSLNSAASIIILNKRVDCPPGKALLFCEQPFEVYNKIIKSFRPFEPLNHSSFRDHRTKCYDCAQRENWKIYLYPIQCCHS